MSCTSFRVNPHSVVCLNVKELLARSRHHIWSLSDSNVIRTHNHLVHKQTLLICMLHLTVTLTSDMASALRKEFLDIQENYRQRIYSEVHTWLDNNMQCQMLRTDKHSQHSSIIWPVWLNCWVRICKLSGCGFESRCCQLTTYR